MSSNFSLQASYILGQCPSLSSVTKFFLSAIAISDVRFFFSRHRTLRRRLAVVLSADASGPVGSYGNRCFDGRAAESFDVGRAPRSAVLSGERLTRQISVDRRREIWLAAETTSSVS